MRYLAFDIECCNGRNICEFGYVIADEDFQVTEKKVFTINPQARFLLTGRDYREDCILSFSESEYRKSPSFPVYYNRILELLTQPDQVVIGYSAENDAKFLITDCKRYNLSPINYEFFDAQVAYGEFMGIMENVSLEKARDSLKLPEKFVLHKSDDDAQATLQILQTICGKLEMSFSELKEMIPECAGSQKDGIIEYDQPDLSELLTSLEYTPDRISNRKKDYILKKFAAALTPDEIRTEEGDEGRESFRFSRKYYCNNMKEALILIKLLADRGCIYNETVEKCDLYIATEEELERPPLNGTSYFRAMENKKKSGLPKILSFSDLYGMLGMTKEEVSGMHIPAVEEKIEDPAIVKLRKSLYLQQEDYLRALNANADPRWISNQRKDKILNEFAAAVQDGISAEGDFKGKAFRFSREYYCDNPKEALILVKLLADRGYVYNSAISKCDLYIATEEELQDTPEEGSLYAKVVEFKQKIGLPEILSFSDVYSLLGITKEELSEMKIPIVQKKGEVQDLPKLQKSTNLTKEKFLQLEEFLWGLNADPYCIGARESRERVFYKFVQAVAPEEIPPKGYLSGKTFRFSKGYYLKNMKEALILVKLLADRGCVYDIYNKTVEKWDLYVATEEELQSTPAEDSVYFRVLKTRERTGHPEIASFSDVLKMLGITKEELSRMRVPVLEDPGWKTVRMEYDSLETGDAPIGQLLKMRGVTLKKEDK